MKKILIDTDIGGDVDDALALAMALNSSELDIVAITNVYLANAWAGGCYPPDLTDLGCGRPDSGGGRSGETSGRLVERRPSSPAAGQLRDLPGRRIALCGRCDRAGGKAI